MGSVLIADSVNHVEQAHSEITLGKIPKEAIQLKQRLHLCLGANHTKIT